MANVNFFQVGGTLPPESLAYVMRQADVDLDAGLRAGDFCYVLNSRQMGKSSLRVRAMQRLQAEGVACAAIDITAIGSQSPTQEQWYAGVARQLLSGLGMTGRLNLRSWWKEQEFLPPVDRLGALFEWLLQAVDGKIAVFVDEIDSVLSLTFPIDDFFAFIRACYNLRVERPEYERLTFALFGVATPGELIRDKTRTPFNVGRAIELTGFTIDEVEPLARGLGVADGMGVMRSVLDWTGGQPFLTQRVCRLVAEMPQPSNSGGNQTEDVGEMVGAIVRSNIIEHWESNDEQTHLRTIRDRVLECGEQQRRDRLGIYQEILQRGWVGADDSAEQMALRLSGLVVKRDGQLQGYNRIYQAVFDDRWVREELGKLRPFAAQLVAWLGDREPGRLLRGQPLIEAREWMAGQQRVQAEEMQFIQAAIEQEQAEVLESARSALVAQEEANQILQAATVEAEGKLAIAEEEVQAVTRRANRRNTVSVAGAIGALVLAGIAVPSSITAQKLARDAQQETKDAKAQKDQLESKSNDLSKQSELLNSQLKATREKEKVAQQKAQAAQQQYQKAQQQEKAAKAQATQAMQQSQVAKQQFGIAPQQAVEAQQKEQQANQQAQAAQGQAAAAADKIQQADQQLAEANQKIVTADRQLATAQQQAAAAEKQATVAAEKTQLANRMLQAVGIQVEATKAQATGLAGQPLLGLVQGIRATGKYQQLIAQASGNESAAPSEIVEAKLQTQAVLSNVYGIQERNILKGHQGRVLSVNFSPDGQTIVSGGADGTVKLTAWDMKQLLQLACNWANDYLRSSPDVSNEDRAICGIQRRGE